MSSTTSRRTPEGGDVWSTRYLGLCIHYEHYILYPCLCHITLCVTHVSYLHVLGILINTNI